jgi:hypothetical protein
MRQRKVNSRALRQLALELLDRVTGGDDIPESERADFATSLVRQWITYDGSATVFLGERQVYLILGRTPLGKPCVVPEPALPGWVRQLTRDWKISPDDLPEVLDQLNRGQRAEVVNGDGVPLRLWVNPREKSQGVEPLAKRDIRPGRKRDYCKIAATELEQQFGEGLDPEEMDELAWSVAKQWQQHDGYACLFLDGHQQLHFHLNEQGDGSCKVVASRLSVDLATALSALGLPPEALPELTTRINLGQEVEFRDGHGTPCVLWHDPKARKLCVREADPAQPPMPVQTPPARCPRCTAALRPWRERERQQTCPLCGSTISLP